MLRRVTAYLRCFAVFVWHMLRREPYYHKLQYSKTPRFDPAAALFGAGIGAFVGYLALSSLGSGGADLTDLLVVFWYGGVWLLNARLALASVRVAAQRGRLGSRACAAFLVELGWALARTGLSVVGRLLAHSNWRAAPRRLLVCCGCGVAATLWRWFQLGARAPREARSYPAWEGWRAQRALRARMRARQHARSPAHVVAALRLLLRVAPAIYVLRALFWWRGGPRR